MPRIFIRHAEPNKKGNITDEGRYAARNIDLDYDGPLYTSFLPRSQQTMEAIFPYRHYVPIIELNEWDKPMQTEVGFKEQVKLGLHILPEDCLVVGHARWMTWAHWLLKGEPALGFDYLEGFET